MIDDDLARFARSLLSLWTADVLLLLHRERARRWTVEAITRELRSSEPLIREIVERLSARALLAREADGTVRYAPGDPALEGLVDRLARLRAERPLALAEEIYGAPSRALRNFSDAFKLKKD